MSPPAPIAPTRLTRDTRPATTQNTRREPWATYARARRTNLRPIKTTTTLALITAAATAAPAHAAISTGGAFTFPMYPAAAPDPWNITDPTGLTIDGTDADPGTLTIDDGSDVIVSASSTMSSSVNDVSFATVTGAGSQWITSGELDMRDGPATVNIQDAGLLSTTTTLMGSLNSPDLKKVVVTGTDSNWSAGNIYMGGTSVSATTSPATVEIKDGATLNVANTLKLWNADATLEVSGADTQLNTRTLDNSAGGTFDHTGGTVAVTNGTFNPGSTNFTINGPGARLILDNAAEAGITGDLIVGNTTDASLELKNGATFSNDETRIAVDPGTLSAVDVDGPGTTWTTTGVLLVGAGGSGDLDITNNATVNTLAAQIGWAGFRQRHRRIVRHMEQFRPARPRQRRQRKHGSSNPPRKPPPTPTAGSASHPAPPGPSSSTTQHGTARTCASASKAQARSASSTQQPSPAPAPHSPRTPAPPPTSPPTPAPGTTPVTSPSEPTGAANIDINGAHITADGDTTINTLSTVTPQQRLPLHHKLHQQRRRHFQPHRRKPQHHQRQPYTNQPRRHRIRHQRPRQPDRQPRQRQPQHRHRRPLRRRPTRHHRPKHRRRNARPRQRLHRNHRRRLHRTTRRFQRNRQRRRQQHLDHQRTHRRAPRHRHPRHQQRRPGQQHHRRHRPIHRRKRNP